MALMTDDELIAKLDDPNPVVRRAARMLLMDSHSQHPQACRAILASADRYGTDPDDRFYDLGHLVHDSTTARWLLDRLKETPAPTNIEIYQHPHFDDGICTLSAAALEPYAEEVIATFPTDSFHRKVVEMKLRLRRMSPADVYDEMLQKTLESGDALLHWHFETYAEALLGDPTGEKFMREHCKFDEKNEERGGYERCVVAVAMAGLSRSDVVLPNLNGIIAVDGDDLNAAVEKYLKRLATEEAVNCVRQYCGTISKVRNLIYLATALGNIRRPSALATLMEWSEPRNLDSFDAGFIGMALASQPDLDALRRAKRLFDRHDSIIIDFPMKLIEMTALLGVELAGPKIDLEKQKRMIREFHRARLQARSAKSPAKPAPKTAKPALLGRNDPCPCGSGRKYKKCCGNK
jgi:hypothetical protein